MRVIDQHIEGLALLDALHAAGDAREGAQPRKKHHRVAPEAPRRGDGGEEVADVVAADQRRINVQGATGPDEAEGRVLEIERDGLGPHQRLRAFAERDGPDARRDLRGELGAVRVVEVHDRDLRGGAGFAGEEPGLHREIGVQRLVVVEVVAREIGKHRRAKLQPEHPLLVDAVRADLHHRLLAAGVAHLRHHAVDVERLGRGAERRHGARAEVVVDGADQADLLLAVEEMLEQVRDRGLPVGAGDADDRQVAVGKLVVALRHAGERGAGVGDRDERDPGLGVTGQLLGDDGHGAAAHGLVDERHAVRAPARQGKEEVARHDAAAVHHEAGNRAVEGAFHGGDLTGGEIIGEFRGHFENAVAAEGGLRRAAHRAPLERLDQGIILREVTDHRRPPSMATAVWPAVS